MSYFSSPDCDIHGEFNINKTLMFGESISIKCRDIYKNNNNFCWKHLHLYSRRLKNDLKGRSLTPKGGEEAPPHHTDLLLRAFLSIMTHFLDNLDQ